MGNLVFQATLGGQVNLVGPNTASTYNLNVPTVNSTLATLAAQTFAGTQTISSGNLVFSGTSQVVSGDFSNATVASRTAFQTSTSNSTTGIYALPNGTSTAASWQASNAADPTNASKILIATNGSTDVQLVSGRNGTGTYLPLTFYTNGSEQMRLDTSGNLGLGVTPNTWFGVYKALQIGGSSGVGSIVSQTNSPTVRIASNWYANGSNQDTYITSNYAMMYSVDGYAGNHKWYVAPAGTAGTAITFTQAMTLDASGNLSVGTTSSSGKITAAVVNNASFQTAASFTNATNADFNVRIQTNLTDIGCSTATPLTFSIGNTERARIDSSGNLLVGGTSNVNINTNGGWYASPAAGATYTMTSHASGTASTTRYNYFYYNNGEIGSITQNGTTAVAYNTTSDYRLKENVQPLSGALARVAALKPCTYTWKAAPEETGEGFIAHELQAVVPHAVTGEKDAVDEDGNPKYQGIDTSFLIATLTAAIQEQQAIIQTLTTRIEALEGAKA